MKKLVALMACLLLTSSAWAQKELSIREAALKAAQPAVAEYVAGKKAPAVTTPEEGVIRGWEATEARKQGKPDLAEDLFLSIPAALRQVYDEYWLATIAMNNGDLTEAGKALDRAEALYALETPVKSSSLLATLHYVYGNRTDYPASKWDELLRRFTPLIGTVTMVDGEFTTKINKGVLNYVTKMYVVIAGKLSADEVIVVRDYLFKVFPNTPETEGFLGYLADQQKHIVPSN